MTTRAHFCKAVLLGLGLASFADFASGQTTPTLTITSPADGAIVQPGQSIQVKVTSTNTSGLATETLIGRDPIGTLQGVSPAQQLTFNLTLPSSLHDGQYSITAVGALSAGGVINSVPVTLIVPVTARPSSLHVSNGRLVFRAPGEMTNLDVSARTSGANFTPSPSSLTFLSSDPSVATVNVNGTVTAVGDGKTQITVTLGGESATVPVTVNSSIPGDLNGDGRVDIDDVHILQKWLNTPANGPNDARDLNHDGKIDALDARILVTLCTRPGCAYK